MSNTYIFFAILVCAVCTFAVRLAPFALFNGKRGMPEAMRRIALKMPPAIIAVLVVYCLKGLPAAGTENVLVTLFSVVAVVALHLWRRNTLLSIASGTALYMALLHFFA